MTQFPSQVYRKVEEAGHFSLGTPNPGNPRAPSREDAGVEAPASLRELGTVFILGGGLHEANVHRLGLSLSSTEIRTRDPPHDLPRPPGVVVPNLSVHRGGGGGSGEGLGMPPRPRVNRRFRTFFARPAPFLLLPSWRRVPARPPLPAPGQAEPAPPQEVWGRQRPR